MRTSVMQAWDVQTPWTLLLQTCGDARESSNLEKLLVVYADPVYAYYRREGLSAVDAEDLTQQLLMSFFLVRRSHADVSRERGRFRDYLLAAARNNLLDWRKGQRAKRRGGDKITCSLEDLSWEGGQWEPMNGTTPDDEFERQWARATWLAALDIFRKRNTPELVEAIDAYYSGPRISQDEAALKLNVTVACFNSRLHVARKHLLDILRELIGTTVDRHEDIEPELQRIKSSLLNE